MNVLAPWAVAIGALAATGVVLLHLVARRRPATYLLPTARFIAPGRTLVSRVATRPRDLLLLVLRTLLVLSAAAAFAQPLFAPARAPLARIVLLDRSRAVANPADALVRVRTLLADGVPTRLVVFESGAVLMPDAAAAVDSLVRDALPSQRDGSLSAALVVARRAGSLLAEHGDSVELVMMSPLMAYELDAATDTIRARWPGRIVVVRTSPRADTASRWTLERSLGADDPLAPALVRHSVRQLPGAVRLRRAVLDAGDSSFARGGGTVVRWDTASVAPFLPTAIAMGDDVVVASFARRVPAPGRRTIARWSDGSAAAIETPIGDGCIRDVGIGLALAGDLPLRPAFQRIVRGLMAPCWPRASTTLVDSAAVARLRGHGALAAGRTLAGRDRPALPLVAWLLGVALACALAELVVRARSAPRSA
ncbi:MAG TPA: hypothetical protein VM033_03350 [Gemmatimonadaceae bacterium]|nr:hypothetical protein [Gemmatimonadaceae bacterium]